MKGATLDLESEIGNGKTATVRFPPERFGDWNDALSTGGEA